MKNVQFFQEKRRSKCCKEPNCHQPKNNKTRTSKEVCKWSSLQQLVFSNLVTTISIF